MTDYQQERSHQGRVSATRTGRTGTDPSPTKDFERSVARSWISKNSYRQYKGYWWTLWLECNHTVRAEIRYRGRKRGICEFLDEAKIYPAPKRVARCEVCARKAELDERREAWAEDSPMLAWVRRQWEEVLHDVERSKD
jgi:hypothetical protein